ncbi:hypothetical protein E6P09_01110 [Haloferax mediterranei ATCC 33500]|uniref:Uncharacterized protein n=1 Tax=Haloferax mediterranei (strain ATCC 33500 / DSM 1411 / JCM 8866 / NBRC 14739 / NCIMB 2177 / R-4) TaxID=523841 RepID=M0IWA9_HALMT|nr:hypothetical protein [Haloferax mediterranei]AHZ23191.1 hypothetical protein BM92_11330 [Haloferax mediterranei ATCC 33500]ELZ99769.1 hypothetical protein C439_12374 [Haloferax mediterranei ATCC 33500]MDX5987446.1 hypothetical protein [Haloferax mediterranei ATCC 33500]QCQ73948.1 hypothetical protein E6P09_01110 [Haloferax mediterranei ATCC 33500]
MEKRTQKAVAFLVISGSMSFMRVVPAVESAANAPAIAWVPELTVGLLWGVSGIVAALGELTSSGIDHCDSNQSPSYVWGFVSLLVAILIVGLAFGYLTGDFSRFGAELLGPIGGLVVLTYFATRPR